MRLAFSVPVQDAAGHCVLGVDALLTVRCCAPLAIRSRPHQYFGFSSKLHFRGTIPSLTVDGTRKPYRAFLIDVTLEDGTQYQLTKLRFSQFVSLNDVLKELYPMAHAALPPFPRRTVGKPTEEQWKERVRALDLYYTGVLAMPSLANNKTFVQLFKPEEELVDAGMVAVVYSLLGLPETVLKVVPNLPKPAMPLRPNDVFIECFASSVNRVDLQLMEGATDILEFVGVTHFPFTPGVDVCGIVRGVGAEVKTLALGDAVMADTGVANGGGMAQYVTVSADKCCKKPKNLSFVEAAAFPHAGLIAYQTLVHDLRIDTKDEEHPAPKRVLITAGHSGVGSIAIQIAKYFGAHVSVTVTAGAEEWVRRLGADEVAVTSQWWVHFANADHSRFDAVFDAAGDEDGFAKSKAVLTERGAYATMLPDYLRVNSGALSAWVKTGFSTAGRKIMSLSGVKYHNAWASPNASDLEKLRLCIEGGDMKTVANHYFPIKQAAEAFSLVRSGNSVGKVVVVIKDDLVQPEREFASLVAAAPAGNAAQPEAHDNSSAPPVAVVSPARPDSRDLARNLAGDDDEDDEERNSRLANPFGN